MSKNYLILNYDYDTASVVFPRFYNNDFNKYEQFNLGLGHNLMEVDYETKSYTKVCFDFSLEYKPENLKYAKQRLIEACDYLVKFYKLKKKKPVVKKQWEIERVIHKFKSEKQLLKSEKEFLSDFVKEDLETKQKTHMRIEKMNHKRYNRPIRECYWTIETYNKEIKKHADRIKKCNVAIKKYRQMYKELKVA